MKTKKIYIALILISLILNSCIEKKKQNAIVTPKSVSIIGDLSQYISLIEGKYEINPRNGGNMKVKIKALKQFPNSLENMKVNLTASMLDGNDMPLSGVNDFKISYNDKDKLIMLLKNGKGEQIISLDGFFGGYKNAEHSEKVKMFVVTSYIEELKKKQDNKPSKITDKNSNSNKVAVKKTNQWDKTLDTYSDYVEQYVVLMKKASKGDLNALSEYPSMMEKAAKFQEQLKDASNDLTPKQVKRMTDIQMKMTNALYAMQ